MSDQTEDEQVEAIKKWFAANGLPLAAGIVLALGGVFGYQTWEASVQDNVEQASALYENLVAAVDVDPFVELTDEQVSTAKYIARDLKTDYPDTTYAHFAALQLAKLAVDAGDLDKAAEELQWALDNGVDESLATIARLRLAQVKLAQQDYDAALALVDMSKAGSHGSAYAELRGDVYYAMGKMDEARQAYQMGVNLVAEGSAKPMLQMKLDDLVAPQTQVAADAGDEAAVQSSDEDGTS